MNITIEIEKAFGDRAKYSNLTNSEQLSEPELEEVYRFSNIHWSNVDCNLLNKSFEATNWFSPEAFCYFLPGILSAGVKESTSDLVIYYSILHMLDRSPNPEYWDEFFIERWTQLSKVECEAVQKWVFWLIDNGSFDEITLLRAVETLELLKNKK